MAEQTPETNTPKPVSLRDNTPGTPPPSPVSAGTNGWMIMTVLLGVTLLVVLVITLSSGGDEGLSEDEVRGIVQDSVGTQVASSSFSVGENGEFNAAQMQQMIDNAVGTEIAAYQPTNTPIPPTPTIIPVSHYADDDAFRGAADAPVVIVEFSDFQCGYCGRWYQTTLPQILEAYPDQVKFVYRDFPIFGEPSVLAAMGTECAEEQNADAFWEMHNRLFERLVNQEDAPLTNDTMVRYAEEIGLDTDAFETCLADERYMDEVVNDFRAAEEYGLRGTPGFVINGTVYPIGAQSFEYFDGLIQAELARVAENDIG